MIKKIVVRKKEQREIQYNYSYQATSQPPSESAGK